jgi:hypothetical protein
MTILCEDRMDKQALYGTTEPRKIKTSGGGRSCQTEFSHSMEWDPCAPLKSDSNELEEPNITTSSDTILSFIIASSDHNSKPWPAPSRYVPPIRY